MKFKSLAALGFFLMVSIAFAVESPLQMLDGTSQQMLTALRSKQADLKKDPTVVYAIVDRLLLKHLDVARMARMAIGRNNQVWNQATLEQKKQFTDAFIDLMKHTYGAALASYHNEKIEFLPLREGFAGKDHIRVESRIIREDGQNIRVDYSLVLRGAEWKVYDFTVEGVGMIDSFRSQFSEHLRTGSLAHLTEIVKKHNVDAEQNNA